MRAANADTGFFHSSAVRLKPCGLASALLALPISPPAPSFCRSRSPKLLPEDPAAAEPNGLLLPLNALNALFSVVVVGDDVGVVLLAGGLNGDGDPKVDFPKIDGCPKDEEPNVGPDDPSLLGGVGVGVVVAPNDD